MSLRHIDASVRRRDIKHRAKPAAKGLEFIRRLSPSLFCKISTNGFPVQVDHFFIL